MLHRHSKGIHPTASAGIMRVEQGHMLQGAHALRACPCQVTALGGGAHLHHTHTAASLPTSFTRVLKTCRTTHCCIAAVCKCVERQPWLGYVGAGLHTFECSRSICCDSSGRVMAPTHTQRLSRLNSTSCSTLKPSIHSYQTGSACGSGSRQYRSDLLAFTWLPSWYSAGCK